MTRIRPVPKELRERYYATMPKGAKVNRNLQLDNHPVPPEDVAAIETLLTEMEHGFACRYFECKYLIPITPKLVGDAMRELRRLKGEA